MLIQSQKIVVEIWLQKAYNQGVTIFNVQIPPWEVVMYQEIKLSNGARLLTEAVPGARSAALGFFVGIGSRHESAHENGAAHFIEHMLFKGTRRRSADQLAKDMDALGGQFNAYTTKEHTCFYARCLDTQLEQSMDILGDMLFHSRFAQEDVDTERGVILEEIGMYEDTPEDLVAERLSTAVYKGTPLARPILGTQATLSGMTGDWLRQWQQEHYRPGVLVAALAGSFSQTQVDKLTELLSALEPGSVPEPKPAAYRPAVTARKKAIEQNHLILAFPAPTYLDPRRPQLLLLNSLLGGGCSSRLFQEVREKRGLCYTVYSYVSDQADTGFLGVYTAVNQEQEGQALDTVRQVVCELADHGPTQEELDRVREQAKANLLMGMESIQSRMSHLGTSALLYHKVRETDEILSLYDAVTQAQLRDLAGEIFQMGQASLSAVGRVGASKSYAQWLGRENDT
jgi:predicted Zn-dependent peptidase